MIVQRILDKRAEALNRREPIPNTLRLPPAELAQLKAWIFRYIECDPFLGFRPFTERELFGMLIFEDHRVSDIVTQYEDQLSFFDFGF